MNPPAELFRQSHFSRYYRVWEKNEDSIVFVPLAEICRENGYLQEAHQICEQGLRHHPQSVSGRLTLARIYLDLNENPRAIALLSEILEDFPGQKEAEDLLNRLKPQEIHPPSRWETCTMAEILLGQGERKRARGIVEKILAFDPKNEQALRLKEKI